MQWRPQKRLEIDLHTAQAYVERLEQQNGELSSRAWSLRENAERSSRALNEALEVLNRWHAVQVAATVDDTDEANHACVAYGSD